MTKPWTKGQTGRENSGKKPPMTSLFPSPNCWQTAIYLFFMKAFCRAIWGCKIGRIQASNRSTAPFPPTILAFFTSEKPKIAKFLADQEKIWSDVPIDGVFPTRSRRFVIGRADETAKRMH